jgi:tetratricopeptide (TPR) repeat protein
MDRQAKENAKSGTTTVVFGFLGIILLVGIGLGGFQVFQFFMNFESNQFKRNVSVSLKAPKVVNGNAVASAFVKNNNANDITNPVINYEIGDKNGATLASGTVKLEGEIPAADGRNFDEVVLGPVTGEPRKLHGDLETVSIKEERPFPKGFPARFAGAFDKTGTALIEALKPMADEVPGFEAAHTAMGIAYQEMDDWGRATEEFKKAIAIAPKSANAQYHLAMALLHEGKTKEADAALKTAQELNPNDQAVKKALAHPGKEADTEVAEQESE